MFFAHKSDCTIVLSSTGRQKHLLDGAGELITPFDVSWTDDQIWRALDLANAAYSLGHKTGMSTKAAEVRKVLELE